MGRKTFETVLACPVWPYGSDKSTGLLRRTTTRLAWDLLPANTVCARNSERDCVAAMVSGRASDEWGGAREPRRRQCRRRRTPCPFPLVQTSENTARQRDQTACCSTRPDAGPLLPDEGRFDRGAKR